MTASWNRSSGTKTTTQHQSAERSAPAPVRHRGTYTDRYDRPHPAPRPEGTYVTGAKRRSTPGRYTDVDGARNRADRTEGYYTLRD